MNKINEETYLVKQVLSGNREAFESLIRQYEGLVLHIVTPLIGINADREDICQDVFLKVYEKLNGFQFRSKLSTWIGNIAYNTSINFLKRKKNILLSDLAPTESGAEDDITVAFGNVQQDDSLNAEEILVEREKMSSLVKAIDELPALQRSILLLFYQDELTLEEIGEISEIPVNTVKSHLFRARRTLKEKL